jgi:hypothetical protein
MILPPPFPPIPDIPFPDDEPDDEPEDMIE